jgi:hypothetical protein
MADPPAWPSSRTGTPPGAIPGRRTSGPREGRRDAARDVECVSEIQWALPLLRPRWAGLPRVAGQVCNRIARRLEMFRIAWRFRKIAASWIASPDQHPEVLARPGDRACSGAGAPGDPGVLGALGRGRARAAMTVARVLLELAVAGNVKAIAWWEMTRVGRGARTRPSAPRGRSRSRHGWGCASAATARGSPRRCAPAPPHDRRRHHCWSGAGARTDGAPRRRCAGVG